VSQELGGRGEGEGAPTLRTWYNYDTQQAPLSLPQVSARRSAWVSIVSAHIYRRTVYRLPFPFLCSVKCKRRSCGLHRHARRRRTRRSPFCSFSISRAKSGMGMVAILTSLTANDSPASSGMQRGLATSRRSTATMFKCARGNVMRDI